MNWTKPLSLIFLGFALMVGTIIWTEVGAQDQRRYNSYTEDRFRDRQPPPRQREQPRQREPVYYQEQETEYSTDPMELATQMVAENGILALIVACLGVFIWKSDQNARRERQKLSDSFIELLKDTQVGMHGVQEKLGELNVVLADQGARIGNLERETESMKEFLFSRLKS